jgi:hypothetical protein
MIPYLSAHSCDVAFLGIKGTIFGAINSATYCNEMWCVDGSNQRVLNCLSGSHRRCRCTAFDFFPLAVYQRTREQADQAFGGGRVGEDRVAQSRIRKPAEHRGLHDGHHLARFGAKVGKAKNAIVRLALPTLAPINAFAKPRVSESVRVRSTTDIGIWARRYEMPLAFASDSVMPTWAS